jgi:dihydroneopterin aldolase
MKSRAGRSGHLLLEGMTFFGHHGHLPAERELGARIQVDLGVETDTGKSGATDRLADTVDYVRVHDLVKGIVEGRRFALLEALAEAIAGAVLALPGVRSVRVKVAKRPPLDSDFQRFAVEIERAGRRPRAR